MCVDRLTRDTRMHDQQNTLQQLPHPAIAGVSEASPDNQIYICAACKAANRTVPDSGGLVSGHAVVEYAPLSAHIHSHGLCHGAPKQSKPPMRSLSTVFSRP